MENETLEKQIKQKAHLFVHKSKYFQLMIPIITFIIGITISLTIISFRLMAPKSFKKILNSCFNFLKMSKSNRIHQLTEEDKIKWRNLLQKCEKDPLIEKENFPPLYEKTLEIN